MVVYFKFMFTIEKFHLLTMERWDDIKNSVEK